MAKDKKSFVLYADQQDLFSFLPDEVAGKLIKHIFSYVNDEDPTADNQLVELAFISIKRQLKRDLQKWETQLEQRREAGRKSAEKRQRNATSVNERSRASTDNVNVNDNDNDNDNVNENKQIDIDKINFVELLNFFNKTFNKKCRVFSNEAKRKYNARLKEGYTKDDIANAMRSCSLSKWHKESNYKDCTLEFFSRANILDKYGFNSESKNNYIATK